MLALRVHVCVGLRLLARNSVELERIITKQLFVDFVLGILINFFVKICLFDAAGMKDMIKRGFVVLIEREAVV